MRCCTGEKGGIFASDASRGLPLLPSCACEAAEHQQRKCGGLGNRGEQEYRLLPRGVPARADDLPSIVDGDSPV